MTSGKASEEGRSQDAHDAAQLSGTKAAGSESSLTARARFLFNTIAATTTSFFRQDPFQLAASLSYFSLLSMAPLLLVVTGVFGLLVDEQWFRNELLGQMRDLIGAEGADLLATALESTKARADGTLSLIIGFGLTFIGATTVFAQLQSALNKIFEVAPHPRNAISAFVRARLISFAIVLGVGFLMLVSLLATAMLAGVQAHAQEFVGEAGWIWQSLNFGVGFVLQTGFFAMLFKYVPDVELEWRDTLLGALTTAALFSIGRHGIGLYLGSAGVGSAYGAAGSAVVFMAWVYYASLILFVGGAITRAVAREDRPSVFSERTPSAREAPKSS